MPTNSCGPRHCLLALVVVSLFPLINVPVLCGQVQPRVLEAVDNFRRVTLSGNVHPMARAEFDRGKVDDDLSIKRILLLLKRSDAQESALQDFLGQQQDKSSENYRAWLTPQQFGAQYGPADTDIQAVTQWLRGQGFQIEKVYSGKTVIEFSGTAGQVSTAFGAALRKYQVNGKLYVANANDPQIPVALAPVVAGIVSLNSFPRQSHVQIVGNARKIPGKPGLEPLFTFPKPGGTEDFYALAPGDFATIYNSKGLISGGNDGTGQSIAIVGETNISVADVQAFRTMFGLPANFTSTNVILNGEDPGITSTSEEGEADLDTQWAGAVAPGATVSLVVSASTPASAGIDLSALYIVEHNLAGVMSESYGSCESYLGAAGNAFYYSLWEQAAAQGITAVVAAGDNGSAGCDDFSTATTASNGLAVSGLASTPYNVAVGGTDFDQVNKWNAFWSSTNSTTGTDSIGTSALSYIPEIPWNQNCAQIGLKGCTTNPPSNSVNIVATSGGSSTQYGKPSWQMSVAGMPNDSHRDLPDVSLFASSGFDGSGYIICQADANYQAPCNLNAGVTDFVIVGGTSAAAPAFAGVMALLNQSQATAQNPSPRQGNANYVLYALAKKTGASCASSTTEATACIFNDITKGNSVLPTGLSGIGTNSVPCGGGSPNCSAAVAGQTGVLVETTNPTTEAWTVTSGYDLVTGLGSVNIASLVTSWSTANTVPTTTTLTLAVPAGTTHGAAENVPVTITVSAKSGTATGGVSLIAKFSDGTTQGLDEFTLSAGTVSATTNSLPGGTNYEVYAHYAGDGANAPSDSAAVTVSVGQESSQTFILVPTFDSSGNQTNVNASTMTYGSNFVIRAYVTNANARSSTTGPPSGTCEQVNPLTCPTGTVTLTDNGVALGTGGGGTGIFNLNNAAYTVYATPILSGGSHTVAANYGGDNSYKASSGSTAITVTPVSTSLDSESFTVTSAIVGTTFFGSVDGYSKALRGVAPTGTVTFYDGQTPIGSGSIDGQPAGYEPQFFASASLIINTGGPHTISAQYSGDANYAPSTTSATLNAVYPTTTTVSVSPSAINFGGSVTVAATVDTTVPASNTALRPTPTVLLNGSFDGAITKGLTVTTASDANGNWELQVSVTLAPSRTESFSLLYQGDSNYAPSTGMSNSVTVNIPDFSLAPAGGLTIVPVAGQTGTGQITITPLSSTPSTVTLAAQTQGGQNIVISGYTISLNPQQISLTGTPVNATLTLAPVVTVPTNAIRMQARQAGLLGIDDTGWWLLSLRTAVTAFFFLGFLRRSGRNRIALGLTVFCLILFAPGCGGGGTVISGAIGSGATGGNGGSGSGSGAGGSAPQATTITLTTSSAKVTQFTPLPITATVTSTSGKPITGSVTFYNFGTAFGSGYSPFPNGQYSFQGNVGQLGIFQVTASYSGDMNNLPSSTSTALIQVVTGTIPAAITANTGGDYHSVPLTIGLQ